MAPRRQRKRQREENTPEAYYDRLLFQCRKDLHKQIKVCKNFLIQKIVRKLKSNNIPSTAQQEERLQQLKGLTDLDPIVNECLRRLGLVQRKNEKKVSDSPGEGSVPPTSEESQPVIVIDEWIIDKILQHKKISEALEKWNGQVTEYHQWVNKRNEPGASSSGTSSTGKRSRPNMQVEELNNSLFVQLGQEEEDEGEVEGGKPKKNRPGQRARRAKAQALEAKRQGRTVETSINWRQRNNKQEENTEQNPYNRRQNEAPVTSSMPADDLDDKNLHPSWQARKNHTSGIVSFEGKKITF